MVEPHILQITIGYFIGRVIVALVFLPRYFEGEIYTAYTFLERRFGPSMKYNLYHFYVYTFTCRWGSFICYSHSYSSFVTLWWSIRGMGDFQLYVMAIMVITLVTLLYTFLGGIKAVVWMDVIQMGVYLGGAILAGVLLVQALPDGWQSFHQTGIVYWENSMV